MTRAKKRRRKDKKRKTKKEKDEVEKAKQLQALLPTIAELESGGQRARAATTEKGVKKEKAKKEKGLTLLFCFFSVFCFFFALLFT